MELSKKIVNGLERISEVFKLLVWEKAKIYSISPIQIQILLFISNHRSDLTSVSHLAIEFNVTKATISDAVRVLVSKELVEKDHSSTDLRSYTLKLSQNGVKLINDLENFTAPLQHELNQISDAELNSMYKTLTQLIYQLNRSGILSVQRTCFGCKFYENRRKSHYCLYLQKNLVDSEIRLDCPEFEEKFQ